MMASEENPVVKAALELLALYGIEAWRNQSTHVKGRRYNGRKGVADVLGISKNGKLVAIECKAPGGIVSPAQREFLDMVKSRGGVAFAARSADWIEETLRYYRDKGDL